jgi:hypothetical protein
MGWSGTVARARMAVPRRPNYNSVGDVQAAGDANIATQGAYGERGTQDYLNAAENFDASASLNKYAQGAWGSISSALNDTLKSQAGQAVGQGRFDSGFYDQDKGVVINRATSQLSNDIAGQSMNALAAQQRNTEGLGQFGTDRTNMSAEMLAARSEQVQNDAREEAARKRKNRSGLLGGIGTAIGYGLGGPVGGYIGGAIGSYAGG